MWGARGDSPSPSFPLLCYRVVKHSNHESTSPDRESMQGETVAALGTGLDEMMRHVESLRESVIVMLLKLIRTLVVLGGGDPGAAVQDSAATPAPSAAQTAQPMDTDGPSSEAGPSSGTGGLIPCLLKWAGLYVQGDSGIGMRCQIRCVTPADASHPQKQGLQWHCGVLHAASSPWDFHWRGEEKRRSWLGVGRGT